MSAKHKGVTPETKIAFEQDVREALLRTCREFAWHVQRLEQRIQALEERLRGA